MSHKPTLYISGPISSDPAPIEEKMQKFASYASLLMDAGHAVVNPFLVNPACNNNPCSFGEPEPGAQDAVHSWSCFLRGDLAALVSTCDAVAVLPGWEESRGARLETDTARAVGMLILPVEQWLTATCARCRFDAASHHDGGPRFGCDYAGPGAKAVCLACKENLIWTGTSWDDSDLTTKPHMRKYCYASKDATPLHRPVEAGDMR